MNKWNQDMPEKMLSEAQFVAIFSDCVKCGICSKGLLITVDGTLFDTNTLHEETDQDKKLLEIRVFTEQMEYRAFREYEGQDFRTRTRDDTDRQLTDYDKYDEEQMLDIIMPEKARTTEIDGKAFTCFTTEGGGKFTLPGLNNIEKVKVRTYLTTDPANGLTYAGDWRIVKFI